MAKEREKIELKPVDEEAEKVRRYVRLEADNAEELEELPPVRVGGWLSPGAREEANRLKVRIRTNEPDIATLIERDEAAPVDAQWDGVGRGRKLPWGWLAVIGCIFGGAILWSLVSVTRSEKRLDLLAGQSEKIIEVLHQEEKNAEQMISAIETAMRGFFGSGSVEEMLKYVRHPQRIAPLMGKHYAESAPIPISIKKVLGMSPLTIDNRATFWIASCELENSRVVQVLIDAPKSDVAKIDWETYVAYQPMPWDDFVRSRPGGYTGDFRVYVEPDSFYSHEFADSGGFASFRLSALHGEESLNGYTLRGGELEQKLTETIAENGGVPTPMILRLHLPEGLDSKRGVYVVEMVCPRWVFVENPEEEEP